MSTDRLFEKYYFSDRRFVDGTTQFHQLIRAYAGGRALQILEIGSGPSNRTSDLLATLGELTGVDISAEVLSNRALKRAEQFDGENLPFGPDSFDLCVSDYVLEHVANPAAHFREVGRVLRPGGVYLLRTPNVRHYVAAISRALPHAAHLKLANRARGLGPGAHDPYPTHYRANTMASLLRFAGASGLVPDQTLWVEKEPSYGRYHPLLFFPMMMYERLVNRFDSLRGLRANLFLAVRKPATAQRDAHVDTPEAARSRR